MNITIAAPSSLPARRANTIQTMKMAQAFTALGHSIFLAVPQFPDAYRSNPNHLIDPFGKNDVGWQRLAKHYGIRNVSRYGISPLTRRCAITISA